MSQLSAKWHRPHHRVPEGMQQSVLELPGPAQEARPPRDEGRTPLAPPLVEPQRTRDVVSPFAHAIRQRDRVLYSPGTRPGRGSASSDEPRRRAASPGRSLNAPAARGRRRRCAGCPPPESPGRPTGSCQPPKSPKRSTLRPLGPSDCPSGAFLVAYQWKRSPPPRPTRPKIQPLPHASNPASPRASPRSSNPHQAVKPA